ncbi:MAG: DUF262 domain-containing protein [Opitutus sp.]
MKRLEIRRRTVARVFDWFDHQCLAVPEIQREFVWNAQRACALLDSIYKGYPVGTLMVWKTGRENANLLRHSLHVLPPFDSLKNREILFLIDGQQRLSVLHQVRRGETIRNSNGSPIRFGDIYFSINGEGGDSRFVYARRPDAESHARVSQLISDRWRRHFRGWPGYKVRTLRECRERLLKYPLMFVFIHTRDLGEMRETFIRINTQGMRITEADRAFTRASRVKPLHRFRKLADALHNGFSDLDKAVYWTTLTLIRGIQDLGQKAFIRLTREIDETDRGEVWFERNEPKVAESIRLACDYLVHQLGVFDFSLLPYENQVALLAVFFYWNNRAQPNAVQRRLIKRWFWHTAVAKRYAGSGYRRNILADAEFFKRIGQNRRGKYLMTERAPADALILEDYRRGSALSRAFQLLLADRNPCYVTNGERIPLGDVASGRNSKELHHIWPRAVLRAAGIPARRYNSIANICYLVGHDNRSFGGSKPCRYLDEYRRQRHFPRAMRSHFIPHKPESPLWENNVKRGFRDFTATRARVLRKAFEAAAGTRLFER